MSRDALKELEELVKTGKFHIEDMFFESFNDTYGVDIRYKCSLYSAAGNTLESAILAALDRVKEGK